MLKFRTIYTYMATLVFFILLTLCQQAQAVSCFETPAELERMHGFKGMQLVQKMDEALMAMPTVNPKAAISDIDMRLLAKGSELERALNAVTSKNQRNFRFLIWVQLEKSIFHSPAQETPANFTQVKNVYDAYNSIMFVQDFYLLIRNARKAKKSSAAKADIINSLKQLSAFLSTLHGREINLLEPQELYSFFGVSKRVELAPAIAELTARNVALNGRLKTLPREKKTTLTPRDVHHSLRMQFFKNSRSSFSDKAIRGYLGSRFSVETIKGLISDLHLPAKLEQKYLGHLKLLMSAEGHDPLTKNINAVLLLYRAYLNVFSKVPGMDKKQPVLSLSQLLVVKSNINSRNAIRIRNEIKLDHLIEVADRLESRIRQVIEKSKVISRHHPRAQANAELAIHDLPLSVIDLPESEFDDIALKIAKAETTLDSILETEVKRGKVESIKDFVQLNYNWERVLVNHAYAITGSDYRYVVFHKDVVDHFKHQPDVGSRFLTALSKSYVPHVNASGLRSLAKIHQEFRDIKLLTKLKAGKTRIYGRLIGDTIHFFGIHHKDEAYKNAPMARAIEKFNAP